MPTENISGPSVNNFVVLFSAPYGSEKYLTASTFGDILLTVPYVCREYTAVHDFKDKEIKAEPHDIEYVAKDTNQGGHFWLLHVLQCIL